MSTEWPGLGPEIYRPPLSSGRSPVGEEREQRISPTATAATRNSRFPAREPRLIPLGHEFRRLLTHKPLIRAGCGMYVEQPIAPYCILDR